MTKIASPEGLKNVCEKFPKLRVVSRASVRSQLTATQITAWVDDGLDDHSYIVPGLGDFGDRYVVTFVGY
jgi:uracil phosphoribosyltransferase